MDVGRAGPLGSIGPAVGGAACSAAVPSLEEGAAVADEADVVSDCRPRFASSMPPRTPAAATTRIRTTTSVVISLAWELERGAGGSRGGAGAAEAAGVVPDAGGAAGSAMVAGAGALPGADAVADAADEAPSTIV